jgi:hypothetical protein
MRYNVNKVTRLHKVSDDDDDLKDNSIDSLEAIKTRFRRFGNE